MILSKRPVLGSYRIAKKFAWWPKQVQYEKTVAKIWLHSYFSVERFIKDYPKYFWDVDEVFLDELEAQTLFNSRMARYMVDIPE